MKKFSSGDLSTPPTFMLSRTFELQCIWYGQYYFSSFVSRIFPLCRLIGDNDFSMRRVRQTPSKKVLVLWRNSNVSPECGTAYVPGAVLPNIPHAGAVQLDRSARIWDQKMWRSRVSLDWQAHSCHLHHGLRHWQFETTNRNQSRSKKEKKNGSKYVSSFASAQPASSFI